MTHTKAWIEMLHRYLATGVGALIVVLTGLGWRDWRQQGKRRSRIAESAPINPGLASLTLLWVCLQGAFGALTVTMKPVSYKHLDVYKRQGLPRTPLRWTVSAPRWLASKVSGCW